MYDFIKGENMGNYSRDKSRKRHDKQSEMSWLAEFVLLEMRGEIDKLRGFRVDGEV